MSPVFERPSPGSLRRVRETDAGTTGELVRKQYLCFNCLPPGHLTSGCKSKYSFNKKACCQRHHSSLHASMAGREKKGETNHDAASSATSQGNATSCAVGTNRGVFFNVVPVKVTASNGRAVNTYVLLDSGSTTHLCDRRLLQSLGVDARPTNVALSTITCDSEKHTSTSADLTISTLEGEESISLNDVLSVVNIPGSPNMFRSDFVKRWPHLRGLRFPQIDQGEIWLLVGAEAGDLILPTETRIGRAISQLPSR